MGAAFPDSQGDAGVKFLICARIDSMRRAQNGQRVSVRWLPSAPDDRGVKNVLAEKRGDVWAVVSEFGIAPGLRAVRSCLLGVRRADRDVEGGVGVAKGGGEDVGGSGVSARNEAGNLCLCTAVAGLSRGVHKCSDRVVAACGFAQSAAGVGGACVQGSRLAAQGTRRSPGAGEPSQRTPRAPARLHDAG